MGLLLPCYIPAFLIFQRSLGRGPPTYTTSSDVGNWDSIQSWECGAESFEADGGGGPRFYAIAFPPWYSYRYGFPDCKAVRQIWRTPAAIFGRPVGLGLKTRPITTWATPSAGFSSEGRRGGPKGPPLKGGRRALYRYPYEAWEIGPARWPPSYTVLKMFKASRDHAWCKNPKWEMRSARAWLPTCASQLARSEDGRRRHGHWAPCPQMVERYDRAHRAAELRLGNSTCDMISQLGWRPTVAFAVPGKLTRGEHGRYDYQTKPPDGNEASEDTPPDSTATNATNPMAYDECVKSDDDSTAASVTRCKKPGCNSEVDIADLYPVRD